MTPADVIVPLQKALRRQGVHALLIDAAVGQCDILSAKNAAPISRRMPALLKPLHGHPLALLVGHEGAFWAAYTNGVLETALIGAPPSLHPKTPGFARLSTSPEGATPLVGPFIRRDTPFGIPQDADLPQAPRHQALLAAAYRDALGRRATLALRQRTHEGYKNFRHSDIRGWTAVAHARAAFLLVAPPPMPGSLRAMWESLRPNTQTAPLGRVRIEVLR